MPVTPQFEDALDVSPLDDGSNWIILEAFHYDTGIALSGMAKPCRIEIPKGFITDFASIPRSLWAIVGGPTEGKYRKAAVVHDFLYRTKGVASRSEADSVLLEAMKVSGCSWHQRTVIYLGVRVGGHFSYKGGL